MKILFANKYFFPNGGSEVYLRILLEELPRLGHQCIPFSTALEGNWPSEYAPFFLPPPGGSGAARLEHMRLGPKTAVTLLERAVYSFEARRRISNLLDHVGGVDAAVAINIYNYMSPSIFDPLKERGIPIAMQIGDYHLMCPNYQFMRRGKPCFLCQRGAYWHGVRHRCVKNSLPASAVRAMAMYVQRWLGIWNKVDLFITPCRFMRDRMAEAGFPDGRLRVMPYPVRVPDASALAPKGGYILCFGRISHEKGLDTLIKSYQALAPDLELILAGRDYDGETARLRAAIAPAFENKIRFIGFKSGPELSRLISGAMLTVVPSRWHDNAPLSVYESLAHGTAVAGAAMGGIPEQIRPGVDGVLVNPDDPTDLTAKLADCLSDPERLASWGRAGRERMISEHDPALHAAQLAGILTGLRNNHP